VLYYDYCGVEGYFVGDKRKNEVLVAADACEASEASTITTKSQAHGKKALTIINKSNLILLSFYCQIFKFLLQLSKKNRNFTL